MKISTKFAARALMGGILLLSACTEREEILPGKRFDLREGLDVTFEDTQNEAELENAAVNDAKTVSISLPATQAPSNWSHKNGSVSHKAPHLAFSETPRLRWSVNSGQGQKIKSPLSADPIVLNGRIYTQDSGAVLRAFSPQGVLLWTRDLTPDFDNAGHASGGGIAGDDNMVVATTGFGETIALDATTGDVLWRHRSLASISAAPVVLDDMIVVISRDNVATALTRDNGRVLWEQTSSGTEPAISGSGAPAAAGRLVILPFTNGEMVGALTRNGSRAWTAALTGTRLGLVRAQLSDISGDPVIDGRRIYAANQAGQLAVIDRRSGDQIWTANDGAYGPAVPVGNSIFVVTDEAEVKRFDARDGTEIWAQTLPQFEKEKKRFSVYAHFGPLVAGNRVWVASADGLLRSFDPETGAPLGSLTIPGGAGAAPAYSDGVMYIQSLNGQLHAFQ